MCIKSYHFLWEPYIARDIILHYVHVSLQILLLMDAFSKKNVSMSNTNLDKDNGKRSWCWCMQGLDFLLGVKSWAHKLHCDKTDWLTECKIVSYKVIWSRIENHLPLSWRSLQHVPSEVSYKPIKLGGVKPRNYSLLSTWIINCNISCFFSAGRSPSGSGCLWPVSKNQIFTCCIRQCLRGLYFMWSSRGLLPLIFFTDIRTMI